jgi:hypothetical protein
MTQILDLDRFSHVSTAIANVDEQNRMTNMKSALCNVNVCNDLISPSKPLEHIARNARSARS